MKRTESPPPRRPVTHVSPVRGCRCRACQGAVLALAAAQEHERAEGRARRDAMLSGLSRLSDYFDGAASPTVGAAATEELLTQLGAKRR